MNATYHLSREGANPHDGSQACEELVPRLRGDDNRELRAAIVRNREAIHARYLNEKEDVRSSY